jgi:hypothetical protein
MDENNVLLTNSNNFIWHKISFSVHWLSYIIDTYLILLFRSFNIKLLSSKMLLLTKASFYPLSFSYKASFNDLLNKHFWESVKVNEWEKMQIVVYMITQIAHIRKHTFFFFTLIYSYYYSPIIDRLPKKALFQFKQWWMWRLWLKLKNRPK